MSDVASSSPSRPAPGVIADELTGSVLQILTSPRVGAPWTGTGTGFFFAFGEPPDQVLAVVTNKHVVEGAAVMQIRLSRANTDNSRSSTIDTIDVPLDHSKLCPHPSPDVDLIALPVAGVIDLLIRRNGVRPWFRMFEARHVPTADVVQSMSPIEDILMMGFPAGISDPANNLPIVRRGITATPYRAEYDNQAQFAVDVATFRGSSGSPVLILNEGGLTVTRDGVALGGTRFLLLGVVFASFRTLANGEVVARRVPTAVGDPVQTEHMLHLGLCVKSRMILELEPAVRARLLEEEREDARGASLAAVDYTATNPFSIGITVTASETLPEPISSESGADAAGPAGPAST
jgi:hypothetical protein